MTTTPIVPQGPAPGQAYAICLCCRQIMDYGAGCTVTRLHLDGVGYPRIRNGAEASGSGWGPITCHDCNVRPGEYHHPGCDVEACPVCRAQLISCPHAATFAPAPTEDASPAPTLAAARPALLAATEATIRAGVANAAAHAHYDAAGAAEDAAVFGAWQAAYAAQDRAIRDQRDAEAAHRAAYIAAGCPPTPAPPRLLAPVGAAYGLPTDPPPDEAHCPVCRRLMLGPVCVFCAAERTGV